MHRRTYLAVIALALACAFVHAYSRQEEQFSVDSAQHDVAEPMKSLTNRSTFETTSETVMQHTADSVDFKPPVLE